MSQCFYSSSGGGNNGCGVSRAWEASRHPAHWWRRGPWSHWCFLHNTPVRILQTATEQPRQQTNACFLLISALWWKRKKPTQEWLEGMACQLMLHSLPLYFFPSWGWGVRRRRKKKKNTGGKWEHVCVLVVGYRAVCVWSCTSVFARNYLSFKTPGSHRLFKELSRGVKIWL